ncbi:hypothetical protein Ga0123461_0238 [Mariprofundus aestuarium]|uniref:Uncharacterized protein n=1 Tax=Mariprofundus aestuarium TaxID=1921086 RepID=A0A2K8KV80_MARES|nr:hypothetical protein [Mariprofundus aestuarium]ATX78690.1 hypothetical protein Ga0123461_0238 [Mariprofundus aestuarium]
MSEKKDENRGEIESANAASASPEKKVKSSSTSSKVVGFFLLVFVIIGGGLAANGQLMPLLDSIKATVESQLAIESDVTPSQPEVALDEPEVKPLYKQAPKQVKPEPVDTVESNHVAASAEAEALLSTIDQLRSELQSMEASQKSLRSGLLEQQRMNLQVRLRWITDPASRAAQIQLAWEEISLLPGLSDAERQKAEAMHALARSNVQKLHQWQASLNKWADALSTPVHADVMPKPEHPWLAWIVGQFHLRQAPSEEARRLSSLRERLLHVSRALMLENWPTDGEWQRLHAELLLHAQEMKADSSESAIDLELPDDFSAIQEDMKTLRDSARLWTQSRKGEF